MREYKDNLEHFVVIQCDYDNAKKISELLDVCPAIEGNIIDDSKYVVITCCPKCGDAEFWHYGKCGHCGYEI